MFLEVERMFEKETEERAKKAYGEGRMEGREEGRNSTYAEMLADALKLGEKMPLKYTMGQVMRLGKMSWDECKELVLHVAEKANLKVPDGLFEAQSSKMQR